MMAVFFLHKFNGSSPYLLVADYLLIANGGKKGGNEIKK